MLFAFFKQFINYYMTIVTHLLHFIGKYYIFVNTYYGFI